MKGFLLDENLPSKILFTPSLPVTHVRELGESLSDTEIWAYAQKNDLVIVTKDTDFSDRIILSQPPPKVIHIRFGNLTKRDFHLLLQKIWPQIELLIKDHKLVNVYQNSLEGIV